MNTVLTRREGAIYEIVLNRPQSLNALNDEMMQDLTTAINEVTPESGIRCVLLKGAGPSFMAGGGVKMFYQGMSKSPAPLRGRVKGFVGALDSLILRIAGPPLP